MYSYSHTGTIHLKRRAVLDIETFDIFTLRQININNTFVLLNGLQVDFKYISVSWYDDVIININTTCTIVLSTSRKWNLFVLCTEKLRFVFTQRAWIILLVRRMIFFQHLLENTHSKYYFYNKSTLRRFKHENGL